MFSRTTVTVSRCDSSHAAVQKYDPPRGEAIKNTPRKTSQHLKSTIPTSFVCFVFFPLGCRGFAPCDKERSPTYCTWSDLTESEEGRQTGQRRGASGAVELWEAAQCSAGRHREGGGGCGAALWTHTQRRTALRLVRRPPRRYRDHCRLD